MHTHMYVLCTSRVVCHSYRSNSQTKQIKDLENSLQILLMNFQRKEEVHNVHEIQCHLQSPLFPFGAKLTDEEVFMARPHPEKQAIC